MSGPISPRTIAILSIGQMGLGIASLLIAHDYRVITNVCDRSKATQDRAKNANIECVNIDVELVQQADYILSIVPPRDAVATAKRIETALNSNASKKDLYYLDLNAISPNTARQIASSFKANAPSIELIDGGVIGGPPVKSTNGTWTKPGIPLSSPHPLDDPNLLHILNTRQVGNQIGSASGLKCCFAALSKGFTALALQSFTTASALGVYEPLQDYLATYNAATGEKARKTVVGCTTKAYRWVEEMNQIGETFAVEGGWKEQARVFREIAGVYEGLAEVVEREGTGGMGDTEGVLRVLGEELGKKN
ncbi:6-phosphogluconate dehydrogenase C-terminal domain-like protein [Setomelanomma holmii]|uniref:6-phosphogluconate dehydrogenase C-terminal domain-like protein n=1 Tax=Setomelanomma holmii TaxID=210430 RepID=A0A9P4HCP7_9PLEO|nr:6-phosphogluconate dehydrogenase C-terminal domain-like protein [Setomelanomma holmii]